MKKVITFTFAVILSLPFFAQVGTAELTLNNLQITQIDLEQKREAFGLNDLELSKMEGSPYANKTFSVGNIYKDEKLVQKSVLLRYNAFAKQIEMKSDNNAINGDYGALIKAKNIHATILGKKYILVPFENSTANGDYYEVVSKGNSFDLYKKTNVNFIKPFVARTSYERDRPAKFKQTHLYYLSATSNGELTEIPDSNRKAIKMFSKKDKKIKEFFKSNNINVSDEDDLKKLIAHYNSLF